MALQEEDVQISIMEDESKYYHSNVELNGILTLHLEQEKKGIVILVHGSVSRGLLTTLLAVTKVPVVSVRFYTTCCSSYHYHRQQIIIHHHSTRSSGSCI
ncbi:MAG TPA: hypothetical protein VHF65_07175 [Nitrososphaera sp.]|nr:hypothetical protein [Nitrososphaera sp.]